MMASRRLFAKRYIIIQLALHFKRPTRRVVEVHDMLNDVPTRQLDRYYLLGLKNFVIAVLRRSFVIIQLVEFSSVLFEISLYSIPKAVLRDKIDILQLLVCVCLVDAYQENSNFMIARKQRWLVLIVMFVTELYSSSIIYNHFQI